MSRQRILVVEDHPGMRRYYADLLRQVSRKFPLDFFLAKNVPEARAVLERQSVDLIVLDWMLPGVNGLDFVKELRGDPSRRDVMIIMATGKGLARDCTAALDAGADDFISKPFSSEVLLARLRSAARRRGRTFEETAPVECGGIRLDPARGEATVNGKPVSLHAKELALLELFLRRPGIIHVPSDLWSRVWGSDSENWQHVLVVTISNLKKSLGPKMRDCLACRRGLGYVFNP
jgi:two-component system phosphate regulon response regulator PhoB